MRIIVQRDPPLPNGTTGRLSADGQEFCFTLEPAGKTSITDGPVCIPAGDYPVKIDFSPRFQRLMPRLFDVPEREGILIHWGNYVENTEGCILVGSSKSMIQSATPEPAVWDSRETFERLYREIEEAQAAGVLLTIRDAESTAVTEKHSVREPILAGPEKT
jgi:hypothetical protein